MDEPLYIIREANVSEESDLIAPTTIWACTGNIDRYDERGIKIAGPIPRLFADRMIDGLRELLQQLGYKVIIETAADD